MRTSQYQYCQRIDYKLLTQTPTEDRRTETVSEGKTMQQERSKYTSEITFSLTVLNRPSYAKTFYLTSGRKLYTNIGNILSAKICQCNETDM